MLGTNTFAKAALVAAYIAPLLNPFSDKDLGMLLIPNAQGQSFYVKPGGNDLFGTDDATLGHHH